MSWLRRTRASCFWHSHVRVLRHTSHSQMCSEGRWTCMYLCDKAGSSKTQVALKICELFLGHVWIKPHTLHPLAQIVSNYLCDQRCSEHRFIQMLHEYIDVTVRRYDLKKVIVMEILRRKLPLRYYMNIRIEQYSAKVDTCNSKLQRLPNTIYWNHGRHVEKVLPCAGSLPGHHASQMQR